jgi:cytoskeletal protein RodZ
MNAARESLALWLRSGRAQKKLSLEDVAKVTKIQARILDKLERGELEGLPADVFVKGFVRSFAKCVGLDEQEAIVRYGACKSGEAAATPTAKALVESMGLARSIRLPPQGTPATPTPVVAAPIEAPAPVVEEIAAAPVAVSAPVAVIEAPLQLPIDEVIVEAAPVDLGLGLGLGKKKRSRKKSPTSGAAPRSRKKKNAASVEASTPATNEIAPPANGIGVAKSVVDDDAHTMQIVKISLDTGPVAKVDAESLMTSAIEAKTDDSIETSAAVERQAALLVASDGAVEEPRLAEGSQRISASQIDVVVPPIEDTVDSTVTEIEASEPGISDVAGSWQPTMPPLPSTPSVPWRRPHITASRAYVVPTLVIDDADPDSADREREDRAAKDHSRLSFLPPILIDREDRSARQGGLTLAVIILLIAATLTLSYLMRRPSPTGDGVTMLDGTSELLS